MSKEKKVNHVLFLLAYVKGLTFLSYFRSGVRKRKFRKQRFKQQTNLRILRLEKLQISRQRTPMVPGKNITMQRNFLKLKKLTGTRCKELPGTNIAIQRNFLKLKTLTVARCKVTNMFQKAKQLILTTQVDRVTKS